MHPLEGKIAVVTGAAGGIGRAVAVKLADMGAGVTIADINLEAAKGTAEQLPRHNPGQAHGALKMDVTDRGSVDAGYDEVGRAHGRIDICVNNAGVSTMQHFELLTEKEYDFNMDVNAKGVFHCIQSQVRYMKASGGRIVNTASLAALRAVPYLAHYMASKFAVDGLTKACALELARYNITVNCVCPGFVRTAMQERELGWEAELRGDMTGEEVKADMIRQTPLGRLCEPEDVANGVSFFVSPEGGFVTGVALPVTGGVEL